MKNFKCKTLLYNGTNFIPFASVSIRPHIFYPITLAPNGMKESLAILKNCFPNGIPTIVIHHIQPTIRFPSAISIHDFFSKRPECQRCKFKALQAYRNSNNCNTPYASCKNPCQSTQQSSKYKPKDITYSSHDNLSSSSNV